MKKHYPIQFTKSHRFIAKTLFIVFGMMLWMSHVTKAQVVILDCPEDLMLKTCLSQAEVDSRFDSWIKQFSFIGGCAANGGFIDTPTAPSACGGSVTVTYEVSDGCEPESIVSCLKTFTVSPPAVDLTVPANYTGTTCMTQDAVNTAFDAWLDEAGFTGGCGVVFTMDPVIPAPPPFCGGSTNVTWTVASDCQDPVSETRTFTIPNAPLVNLTIPADYPGTTCMTQDAVNTAFDAWLDEAELTGGCGAVLTRIPENPVAPPSCGGSTTVTWNVTSDCQDPVSETRTFTIPAVPAITLIPPEELTITVESGCMSQADIDAAFNNWLGTLTVSGGCNPVVTPSTTVAPGNCGSVTVTWTATDGCSDANASSVFSVVNLEPDAVSLTLPDNIEVSSGFTQDVVNGKFVEWISDVTYGGGCNSVFTTNNPEPPSACGGSVEVIWTVTSECEIVSGSRTFSVVYSPLLYDNIVSEENPNAPLIDYYDAQSTAYITNGFSGSENNLDHWLIASWTRCLQDGVNIGHPDNNSHTPEPVANNKSGLYLQISAGDFILVEKVSYKNNITIVVCGYLEIGEFSVEESDDDDEGAFLNNVNIVICPNGFLKAKRLELKNTVTIYNYGTMQVGSITGQGSASSQCITGTGNFQDLYGNTIIEHDTINNVWHVNDDYVNLVDPDPENPLGWTFGDDCDSPVIISPLPVELLSFGTQVEPDHIEIQWTTASELNNDFFTVERSTDFRIWEIVGYKQGAGTTSQMRQYSLNDYNPINGISYYRLKQTDLDGQFEYFGPISVSYTADQNELDFRIVKNQQQWIIHVMGGGEYNIELYSLSGQKLYSGNITGELTIPAPKHAVVVRIFSHRMQSVARVVM